ncbi:hypothetical protein [Halomontanus rarus]|uniref:hypothetical protein n=1 Tax=Halomontanus rarus TaxID=3034020 RepID=UPI0023E77487|nr:hypothetical protein [Halovivax sp. TS33]
MNRRELLTVSASSALLGTGGCLTNLGSWDEDSTENDVPGCTQKEKWITDITAGPADPDPNSIVGRRDCANADRPEPTGDVCKTIELEREDGEINEFHSTGVEPYPDPPTAFDEESLTEYVHEYERAYSKNGAVSKYDHSGNAVSVAVGIDERETQVLNYNDKITVVRIEFGVGVETRNSDGSGIASDQLSEVSVYAIDESGIVRTDAEYTHDESIADEILDLVEEGTLLECF